MKNALYVVTIFTALFFTLNPVFAQDDKVIAQVGDTKITESDLNTIIAEIPPMYRAQWSSPSGKKKLIQRIVEMKMFSLEARRLKLDEKTGVKMKIDGATEQVLAAEYLKHMQEQVTIDEAKMKEYYDKNKNKYKQEEQVKARHILLKTEEDAKEVQKQLNDGKDFVELAKEKSTGPTKNKGGDLGWFARKRMVPEFDEVVFTMKKGDVSEIVKTQFGYHIIRVDDKKDERQKTYDEVKEQIKEQLVKQQSHVQKETEKARLMKEYKVEILDESLK